MDIDEIKKMIQELREKIKEQMANNLVIEESYKLLTSIQENIIIKSNNLLCGILKEYCGGMNDAPEYYETERNSEAEAVMFLKEQGLLEIIEGEFLKTKHIKFKFVGKMKCENCEHFQSYRSAYEDEEEPHDMGFCQKEGGASCKHRR